VLNKEKGTVYTVPSCWKNIH